MRWGWVVALVLAGVLVWMLLKPSQAPDNSALIHRIDSLTHDNQYTRQRLNGILATIQPAIDSLTRINDSLNDRGTVLAVKLNTSESVKLSLARQVEYWKSQRNNLMYDSSCDELAKKVLSDSMLIREYQVNTNEMVSALGKIISGKDSIIDASRALNVSDFVLQSNQKDLIAAQDTQIKKLNKKVKLTTWIGRSLLVVVGGLVVALSVK